MMEFSSWLARKPAGKKPRKPLKRTPLKRSTKPLTRTQVRRVSKKQRAALKDYFAVRASYLARNAACEAGPVILKAKLPASYAVPRCEVWASQVHHLAGRGKNLCNEETFCAVCDPCHKFIHAHAQKSREPGLLI